jgi:hypothetical protein
MGDDTLLYVEVPFEDIVRTAVESENLTLKKRHWHEHINFFSLHSLEMMLRDTGFNVLRTSQLHASAGGNSSHLLQIACKRSPL